MDDGKANALSPAMIGELMQALAAARDDAGAVVLSGREGRFCAGFDLKVMMQGPEQARDLVMAGAELLLEVLTFPRPVVAACTGHALAAGALLLLTSDVRIGARGEFKIGLNEVRNNMPVPIFAHELARERLERRHFTRAVLGAHVYDPATAVEAGYLDQAVGLEEVVASARQEAQELAQLPARAYALTKKSIRRRLIDYVRETMEENYREMTGQG